MTVCLSTKTCERLQKKQLKQTDEVSHNVTRQRGNVYQLDSRLTSELKRQIRFQEEKKRVFSTGLLPMISNRSTRQGFVPRKMHFKRINNRICSGTPSSHMQDMVCHRRDVMEDVQLGRHFCELLGPRLCVDCIKVRERVEALKENEENPTSLHLEREPFNAFVSSFLTKQHEDDESYTFDNDSLNQDELSDLEELNYKETQSPKAVSKVIFSPSPPGTGDSGFSSRLSRIRGLTRAQSCSIIRNFTPFSPPLRREKTHVPRIKQAPSDSRKSSGFGSPSRGLSREYSSDRYGFLSTIQKLHKRAELGDVSRAWSKSPVEPVLMELKLINFTEYTELGYEPPPAEPEPQPEIVYDEFGFPIMDTLSVPSS